MIREKSTSLTIDKAESLLLSLNELFGMVIDEYMEYGNIHTGRNISRQISATLNDLFTSPVCQECIFTDAADKAFFGIYVQPVMGVTSVAGIITGDTDIEIAAYRVEFDTRVFNGDYTSAQVLAILLFEFTNVVGPNSLFRVRMAVDAVLTNNYKYASGYVVDYNVVTRAYPIFCYAIIKFLNSFNTLTNTMYYTAYENIWYFQLLDLDKVIADLIPAHAHDPLSYIGDEECNSKLSIFTWAFEVADEPTKHAVDVIDTMANMIRISGSRLESQMCEQIIRTMKEGTKTELTDRSVKEAALLEGFSIVKGIKANGLRSIEDDLYEYKIRIKNCEDEEDAIFILRQINTRLTILADYLENTDNITDGERRRWEACMDNYRMLRAEIGHKKIGNKKQYGIFIDYDKLDQL